ncbi:MAG TPA: phosphotransferase [Acidimicrobiales bacterium]|nr:phosphotransferase [Acidimicrobiales bacterium]
MNVVSAVAVPQLLRRTRWRRSTRREMLAGMQDLALKPRPVASSLAELLSGATSREPFLHSDSKSGSSFERVLIDGQPHVLKYVHLDDDWTMRFCGDVGCNPLQVWASGLMDVLPGRIDHGMIGAAAGLGRNGWGAALLMRDLSDELVPAGDDPITLDDHLGYLDTMAALAARTWNWVDDVGLVPLGNRWSWFGDGNIGFERDHQWPNLVPRIAHDGWEQFAQRAPRRAVVLADALRNDSTPLVDAVTTTPQSFVHGDWKLGNVGTARDGRTALIDWTYPGSAPVCHDLGWYLALNSARLPETKEAAIDALRASLERHGVDTAPWWDRQSSLCLLGALVEFGWEKALGDRDELAWWCDRALEGERYL